MVVVVLAVQGPGRYSLGWFWLCRGVAGWGGGGA